MYLQPSDIARVVQDEAWQEVRDLMQGKSTQDKLSICVFWLDEEYTATPLIDRQMQVMNYLIALASSGHIIPIRNKTQDVKVICQTIRILG